MELIVRAVDVGSGNTKFVTAAAGTDIRCASFPRPSPIRRATTRRRGRPVNARRPCASPSARCSTRSGPDVSLAADTFRAKQLHDEYTETPGVHGAAARGALHDEAQPD